jgi:hypothetical protein
MSRFSHPGTQSCVIIIIILRAGGLESDLVACQSELLRLKDEHAALTAQAHDTEAALQQRLQELATAHSDTLTKLAHNVKVGEGGGGKGGGR